MKLKKLVAIILTATLIFGCVQGASADMTLTEAQEALNEANAKIAEIEEQQDSIQTQIDELDASLVQILVDIDTTKNDIETKQNELAESEAALEKAQQEEEEQHESMNKRIQYIYENGGTVFNAVFEGFADMLSRVELSQELYNADRKLLDEYKETVQTVQDLVNRITEEKNVLQEFESTLEEEQAQLEEEVEQKKTEYDDFDAKLHEAEDLASQYQSLVAELIAAKQAAEAAASYSNSSNTSSSANISSSSNISVSSSNTSSSANTSSAVVDYASQFVGNKYTWGGTSLTNGCDCSGFVVSVYAHFGVSLPHSSSSLRTVGTGVSVSDMRPGDIVCYSGHVGIYAGDGLLLNASNSKPYPAGGIKYTNVYYKTILAVRRIF